MPISSVHFDLAVGLAALGTASSFAAGHLMLSEPVDGKGPVGEATCTVYDDLTKHAIILHH